jgi:GNAT superfamily N-acetyltransferase
VLNKFRGNGIQRMLLNARYEYCLKMDVEILFIDVPEYGYQLEYYSKNGYKNLGYFNTDKIQWDLGPSLLMFKYLR